MPPLTLAQRLKLAMERKRISQAALARSVGIRQPSVADWQPRAGDGVLVRDDDGNHFFRIYRERRPGHWEAAALNPAFQALNSERDGLHVLAVMTAVFQRWG